MSLLGRGAAGRTARSIDLQGEGLAKRGTLKAAGNSWKLATSNRVELGIEARAGSTAGPAGASRVYRQKFVNVL
jgi:hypothetical protein